MLTNKKANHTNINVVNADIFEVSKNRVSLLNNGCSVIIPHVCNNINLFGAGFAAAVANKYPEVKENFHMLGNQAKLGHVQYIKVLEEPKHKHRLVFANMIAQNKTIGPKNIKPLSYEHLVQCMIDVRNHANAISKNTESKVEIHCPKFGSGLAGGNWNFIEELISEIWSQFSVTVYVYKQPKH